MRHQILILNRGRKRAPNLRSSDRIIAGLCTLLMRPARVSPLQSATPICLPEIEEWELLTSDVQKGIGSIWLLLQLLDRFLRR